MNSLISIHVINQVLVNKKYRATLFKTSKNKFEISYK
jgi:hypothetical protein